MTRRAAFLATAALAAVVGAPPLPALAQQAGKPFRIGVLSPAERTLKLFDAFRDGLRELGYTDGQNIMIEYRFAAGDASRLPAMAAELAHLPVEVMVTDGGAKTGQIATRRRR